MEEAEPAETHPPELPEMHPNRVRGPGTAGGEGGRRRGEVTADTPLKASSQVRANEAKRNSANPCRAITRLTSAAEKILPVRKKELEKKDFKCTERRVRVTADFASAMRAETRQPRTTCQARTALGPGRAPTSALESSRAGDASPARLMGHGPPATGMRVVPGGRWGRA